MVRRITCTVNINDYGSNAVISGTSDNMYGTISGYGSNVVISGTSDNMYGEYLDTFE